MMPKISFLLPSSFSFLFCRPLDFYLSRDDDEKRDSKKMFLRWVIDDEDDDEQPKDR